MTARGLLLVSQNLFQNCGRTAQHVEEQTPFAATREKSAQKQARPSTATIQLKKKKDGDRDKKAKLHEKHERGVSGGAKGLREVGLGEVSVRVVH